MKKKNESEIKFKKKLPHLLQFSTFNGNLTSKNFYIVCKINF